MRKTNCLHLSLTAVAFAAVFLIATSTRAGVGNIYETNNDMILKFTGGTPNTFASSLSNPKGLAFDGNGHVFVAEASRGTIIRFNTIDGTGDTYASGLSSPVGLTFDQAGNLYEADSGTGTIFKFASDATKTTFATGLGAPGGVAFDSNGNLFVADFAGGTIYKITPDGTKSTFAAGLNLPAGLAVDSANNLFEADSGSGTIFKFTPAGVRTTFATGLSSPYGLAFEASGNLIEADKDSGSTFRFTPAGVRTTVFASDFNTPQFVAIEPAPHQVLNISTRGFVDTGDHILIGGFIIGGNGPVGALVVLRAIGPSLSTAGIVDPLADPVLELHNATGALIASNNNWKDNSPDIQSRLVSSGLAPTDDHESAILTTLLGGSYTAVVYGANGTTGTAVVEVYNVP